MLKPMVNEKSQLRQLRKIFSELEELLPAMKSITNNQASVFLNCCHRLKYEHERDDIPQIRGTERGLQELKELTDLFQRLVRRVNDLSLDARQSMTSASAQRMDELSEEVEKYLVPAVQNALGQLNAGERVEAPKGKRKAYERQVATLAKATYTKLTGKKRHRTIDPDSGKPIGPLVKFVADVFSALNIDASAGNMIRPATKPKSRSLR
jgi:hypothetical protein